MKDHLSPRQNQRVRDLCDRVVAQLEGNTSAAAAKMGVERTWLSRFLKRESGVSLQTATTIALALDESVQELLELPAGPVAWSKLPGFEEAKRNAKLTQPHLAEWIDAVGGFSSSHNPDELDSGTVLMIARMLQSADASRAKKLTSGSDTSPPSKRGSPRGSRRSASKIKTSRT